MAFEIEQEIRDTIPDCAICGGGLELTVTENLGAVIYFTFRCKRCGAQGNGDVHTMLTHNPDE